MSSSFLEIKAGCPNLAPVSSSSTEQKQQGRHGDERGTRYEYIGSFPLAFALTETLS